MFALVSVSSCLIEFNLCCQLLIIILHVSEKERNYECEMIEPLLFLLLAGFCFAHHFKGLAMKIMLKGRPAYK